MKNIFKNLLFNNEDTNSKIIKNNELENKMKNNKVFILDVREPWEYQKKRIPGSKLIPLSELKNRLGELDKNKEIHIICHTGSRAKFATKILSENGFNKVLKVSPGYIKWQGKTESDN